MTSLDGLEPVEREPTPSIIADRIRQRIIDGTFAPATQLGEAQLAERLHVSRGSVREALQRLIQEGLLRNVRHRGVFVVEITEDDVADIYLARGAVEREAVRLLVRRGDDAPMARLAGVVDEMERASATEDWSAIVDRDLLFHETLVAATGSKRLMRVFSTLLAETRMCMTGLESTYTVWRDIVAEHRELLDAMRRGEGDDVLDLVDNHFESAVRDLERARERAAAGGSAASAGGSAAPG